MRRKDMMKKNKGFTLVELIIAVAILAIIAAPLLGNFVQSAKMNQKARQNLDGMNMAQDIMEGMAAYTGDEIINMFESKATLQGKIIPAGSVYSGHGDTDASGTRVYQVAVNNAGVATDNSGSGVSPQYTESRTYDATNGVSKTVKAQDDYYFYLSDVKMGSHEFSYDVHLKSRIKNKKAEASNIDKTFDAVYTAGDAYDSVLNDPVKGFRNLYPGIAETDYAQNKIKRKIKITIKLDDKLTADTADDEYPVLLEDVFDGSALVASAKYIVNAESNIFANSAAEAPANVYVFYPASVTSVSGTTIVAPEEFWIYNETNNDVNVFLIRQKSSVTQANNGQNVTININDKGSDGKLHTYLISNARFDLNQPFEKNIRTKNELDNPNTDEYLLRMYGIKDPFTGTYSWPYSYYDRTQSTINYKLGGSGDDVTGFTQVGDSAVGGIPAYNTLVSDGIMKRDSAGAYDVEITVYQKEKNSGALKKVASYSGALAN